MIEKSLYENYEIDFDENILPENNDYIFIFNDKRQLYLNNEKLPSSIDNFNAEFCLYIGKFKNTNTFVAQAKSYDNFHDLTEIYEISHDLYLMATRAVLIRDWYVSHQYCGRCGAKTENDEKDMMLKCPECMQIHYPRIAPAIIVAIRKKDKLLMAKHSYHKSHRYALIAGFVEAGESIEEAVRREVKEEVGIEIKNLKYQKSQSWPFPNSLMLAFTAEYDCGDIKVDGDEIVKAKWFSANEIERYPSDISISDWLVQSFIDSV